MPISKVVILIAVLAASIGGYVMINPHPLKPGEVITPFGIQNKSQLQEIIRVSISVEPSMLSMAKGESKVTTVSLLGENLTENTSISLGIQKLFPREQLPKGITAKFYPETTTLEPNQKISANLTISTDQTAEEGVYKLQIVPALATDVPISKAGRDIIDLTIKS